MPVYPSSQATPSQLELPYPTEFSHPSASPQCTLNYRILAVPVRQRRAVETGPILLVTDSQPQLSYSSALSRKRTCVDVHSLGRCPTEHAHSVHRLHMAPPGERKVPCPQTHPTQAP